MTCKVLSFVAFLWGSEASVEFSAAFDAELPKRAAIFTLLRWAELFLSWGFICLDVYVFSKDSVTEVMQTDTVLYDE